MLSSLAGFRTGGWEYVTGSIFLILSFLRERRIATPTKTSNQCYKCQSGHQGVPGSLGHGAFLRAVWSPQKVIRDMRSYNKEAKESMVSGKDNKYQKVQRWREGCKMKWWKKALWKRPSSGRSHRSVIQVGLENGNSRQWGATGKGVGRSQVRAAGFQVTKRGWRGRNVHSVREQWKGMEGGRPGNNRGRAHTLFQVLYELIEATQFFEVGVIIIPILEMRKLMFTKGKSLTQGPETNKGKRHSEPHLFTPMCIFMLPEWFATLLAYQNHAWKCKI